MVPSFATFSPGLPNNTYSTACVWTTKGRATGGMVTFNLEANHTLFTPIVSVDTTSSSMTKVLSRIAGQSA